MEYFAHETSHIDVGCTIGKESEIGAYCLLQGESEIGEECKVGNYVRIAPKVKTGNHVEVSDYVTLYEGLEVEDEVFIGPSTSFINLRNPRARQQAEHKELGKTILKKGCSTGANSTIMSGITLGEYCFIGAGAVVLEDVLDYALMVGVPAKRIGWMSRDGGRLYFGLEGTAKCPVSGKRYKLDDGKVHLLVSE